MYSIPPAPPLPSHPGFYVPGYSRLVQSLPEEEKQKFDSEDPSIIPQEIKACAYSIISCCPLIALDGNLARRVTLTALKALEQQLITVEQLASFHILDGALRDLVTHSAFYQVQKTVIQGNLERKTTLCESSKKDINELRRRLKDLIKPYTYDAIIKIDPALLSSWESMPTTPLLQSFFNFNQTQWNDFCHILKSKPPSEQIYYTINAPCLGSWSPLISRIQEMIRPLQTQKIFAIHSEGITTESLIIVPSFSMLQAFIDVTAKTFGRKPPQLVPTYYRLNDKDYARLKVTGQIPISLYFPEASADKRYQWSNPQFKGLIDGFEQEGPFASALHDVYHALRELEMTEKMRDACYYLANLAEQHPKNSKDENSIPVSELLIDGELILCNFRHPLSVFKNNNIEANTFEFIFGDIFHFRTIKMSLHDDLKSAFITDMVRHKQRWKEHFGLGREDLREAEQKMYDAIYRLNFLKLSDYFPPSD